MATDKLLHEYTTRYPNTMAKFIHAEADDYEAQSVTFKETEKRADIFLIGRSGQHVVLLENQGYENEDLYYDMVKKIVYFCTQHKYRGNIDATAIFLEEAHFRAAESSFARQFGPSSVLRFTPKVFVFRRIKVEELSQQHDVHLIPLYPLCDISPEEIQQQAPGWAKEIKNTPELTVEDRKNLLVFLGGAISHRIKTMTEDEIYNLFGGFNMEDTPIVQQILERKKKQWVEQGMQQGMQQGIQQGIQQILLKQMAARFGVVPEDIRQKVEAISNTDDLGRIATALLTIQSIDELKNLVN